MLVDNFGIFEHALIAQDPKNMSDWHRRLAELFEDLFNTGYLRGEGKVSPKILRFLPNQEAIAGHPAALPSDKLEVVLDRYKVFAVGNCQCRMARQVAGEGCQKPVGNCLSMGDYAAAFIRSGQSQEITKKTALEIKLEAESNGLVTWIYNAENLKGQVSCSYCGCCCAAMRAVNEFAGVSHLPK